MWSSRAVLTIKEPPPPSPLEDTDTLLPLASWILRPYVSDQIELPLKYQDTLQVDTTCMSVLSATNVQKEIDLLILLTTEQSHPPPPPRSPMSPDLGLKWRRET